MSFNAFRKDIKTMPLNETCRRSAKQRSGLEPQAETLCPGPPWSDIRGLGNWLRHQDDRVDLETIWHTATEDLPPFKAAIAIALQQLDR
jgi:hypothetical protein